MIFILPVLLVLAFFTFYTVKQKTAVIIERLGKFQKVSEAGLHLKIPFLDRKAGKVNLRTRELPVEVETKTKDDVFVHLTVSVQYYVSEDKDGIRTSFYKFDDPDKQIRSFVFDSIRSEVPKMELDEVFAEKDKIATAVKLELLDVISEYGFSIVKTLVTDIDPDAKVKQSMNEINAAKRLKEAAKQYAEAEKIKVVAAAEAEAESKKLQGEGIANQRIAIAQGLKQSVSEVKGAMDADVSSSQVMNMLFMTQHYDTVSRLGENGINTIFLPYSPDSVGDLQTQIQGSMLAVDAIKNSESQEEK